MFEKEKLNKVFSVDFGKLGVLKHSFLSGIIENNVPADSFEDLEKELFVSVSNLNKGINEIFSSGMLKKYVLASSAIPIVFRPVVINGVSYVDGGLTDNLPAEVIRKKSKLLVGSHVNYKPTINEFKSFRDIAERSFRIAIYNTIEGGYNACDYVFDPPEVRDFGTFDLNKYYEIYETGYKFANYKIKEFIKVAEKKLNRFKLF